MQLGKLFKNPAYIYLSPLALQPLFVQDILDTGFSPFYNSLLVTESIIMKYRTSHREHYINSNDFGILSLQII